MALARSRRAAEHGAAFTREPLRTGAHRDDATGHAADARSSCAD
jgi:hypothetical protein